jgi:hypothetical protein
MCVSLEVHIVSEGLLEMLGMVTQALDATTTLFLNITDMCLACPAYLRSGYGGPCHRPTPHQSPKAHSVCVVSGMLVCLYVFVRVCVCAAFSCLLDLKADIKSYLTSCQRPGISRTHVVAFNLQH